jgi:signal peptidase I
MRGFLIFIWETIKIIVISVLIVVPIRYFVVQPFFVRGASMEPSFDEGHYLIIDEIGYRFSDPQRGDVIVFRYPHEPSQYYIKRIVGVPDETIEISGGRVIVYNKDHPSGLLLDEGGYLANEQKTTGSMKVALGHNEYFVMGDNRDASSDSRSWGPLGEENFIGRVWLRIWPFGEMTVFAAPAYSVEN